ncbi:MAG: hypothetical protein HW421_587 [Ignavibacteria bacterium]|nr:hypothetical protein [Ignavibacteria bacterium]
MKNDKVTIRIVLTLIVIVALSALVSINFSQSFSTQEGPVNVRKNDSSKIIPDTTSVIEKKKVNTIKKKPKRPKIITPPPVPPIYVR